MKALNKTQAVGIISDIIFKVRGKDCTIRRFEKINEKIKIEPVGEMVNFGVTGTIKEINNEILVTLGCSRLRRNRKNGYSFNVSDVYRVCF